MRSLARFVLGKAKPATGPDAPSTVPVKMVLFDFDGTLADTFADGLEILNDLSKQFGFRRLEGEDIERARDMTTRQVMKFLGVPSRKLPTIAQHGVTKLKERMPAVRPFPGIAEMVQDLTSMGVRVGIVTSNSEENVNYFLRNHQIDGIEFVRSSSRLLGKARVIRRAMKEFNFRPEDSLFVGDETRDIEACRRADLRCIAVTWGYNSERALSAQAPYRIIHSPTELKGSVINY